MLMDPKGERPDALASILQKEMGVCVHRCVWILLSFFLSYDLLHTHTHNKQHKQSRGCRAWINGYESIHIVKQNPISSPNGSRMKSHYHKQRARTHTHTLGGVDLQIKVLLDTPLEFGDNVSSEECCCGLADSLLLPV